MARAIAWYQDRYFGSQAYKVKKYETGAAPALKSLIVGSDTDKLKFPVAIPKNKTKNGRFSHPRSCLHARSGLQSQIKINILAYLLWNTHEGKLSFLSCRLIK